MELLNVVVAAIASFAFGAVWYMTLQKQWLSVSGVEVGEDGNPKSSSDPIPYIMSFVTALLVAGMMRHMFATSAIDTVWEGIVSGLGVGAFFITPWLMMTNLYCSRPLKLTIIDGGYATIGCSIIGAVLMMF